MDAMGQAGKSVVRLRRSWRFVLEATVAASVAYFFSDMVLHHPVPFFAPASALLVLGAARGRRRWRAAEVMLGVAAGVLLADIVAILLGPGTTLTVCVVIALTATTAIALGASTALLAQAMSSAIYVAIVAPPTRGWVPTRFIDALVGGGVALVVTALLAPRDPLRPATSTANALLGELSSIVEQLVDGLRTGDIETARGALVRARTADELVDRLVDDADGARETIWFATRSNVQTRALDRIQAAATPCDYLVRNVRVLARSSVVLLRDGSDAPQNLLDALTALAAALRLAGESYADEALLGDARSTAVRAVALAAESVPDEVVLQQVTMVGQVRAATIDLLRATGVNDRRSIDVVDEALGGGA